MLKSVHLAQHDVRFDTKAKCTLAAPEGNSQQ